MANSPTAKKRVRQIARRTEVNQKRRSRIRTFIRRVEAQIARGDRAAALAALQAAQPELMRGAAKGVLHRNTASRKISRLQQRINRISA